MYADVLVGEAEVFGCPRESRLHAARTGQGKPGRPVWIGDQCMIFTAVILYEGVELGVDCVVEDRIVRGS